MSTWIILLEFMFKLFYFLADNPTVAYGHILKCFYDAKNPKIIVDPTYLFQAAQKVCNLKVWIFQIT